MRNSKNLLTELLTTRRGFYRRVVARLPHVRRVSGPIYLVAGLAELGDSHPTYVVDVEAGTCSCHYTQWGHRRRRCTHLAAALLVHTYGEGVARVGIAVVEGCEVSVTGAEKLCRRARIGRCGGVGQRCVVLAETDEPVSIEVVVDGKKRVVRLVPEEVPRALLELLRAEWGAKASYTGSRSRRRSPS